MIRRRKYFLLLVLLAILSLVFIYAEFIRKKNWSNSAYFDQSSTTSHRKETPQQNDDRLSAGFYPSSNQTSVESYAGTSTVVCLTEKSNNVETNQVLRAPADVTVLSRTVGVTHFLKSSHLQGAPATVAAHISQSSNLIDDDIPQIQVEAVNCAKLIQGDKDEQLKADKYQTDHPKLVISDEQIYNETQNCSNFISDRRYITKPVNDEEENFSLAYSILLFKDVEQFERLLRAIYRPQNVYCVHVDKKSPQQVQNAVIAIVRCFDNVFMSPEQFDVHWGKFSVLQPELSCMTELLKHKRWKYFINLTGQEFPLKTNWEIVQILKIFNGANNLEGTIKRRNLDRTANRPPPPQNVTVAKGSVHILAARGFVEYVIYNETSLEFLNWVRNTEIPDETYFASLNLSPHLNVPGSYLGNPETDDRKNLFITRFKNWNGAPISWPCGGKYVRTICVFGVRDLHLLSDRVELFANKFHIDYEPLTLDCLEELHFNRTRKQLYNEPEFNLTFYADLDFVRNHI